MRPLFVLGVLIAPIGAAAAPSPDCAPGPTRSETLAAVGLRGEIGFASGGRAVLASLRWPEEDAVAREWLAGRVGQRLQIVPRGQPDRWGRERIDALADEDRSDLPAA